HRVLGLVRQMRAPVLHLRNPRILVCRTLPLLVGRALLALAIQPRQVFTRRRRDARRLRQLAQKLLVTRARVPPHNRAHCCVRLQRRRINRDPLPLQQSAIGQHAQHPGEYFAMRVQIDQPPRARDRRVVRRILVQRDAHETPQCQRVCQTPSNAALRSDALEIPDQQSPKIDPRRQRRSPVLGRIELRAPLLDKLVEALRLQQLVQLLVKRMPRSRCQLRVRNPNLLLLLPPLMRPHRHVRILRIIPVTYTIFSVPESRLAPQPAKRVLMYCPEDSISRVVVPRLIAAGTNLSKIDLLDNHSFRTYCPDGTKIKRCLAMDEDIPALLTLLGKHPDIALIECDPITGIWGDTNVNHNKEIWPVVAGLMELCEKRNLTFLGVAHTNKRGN